MNTSTTKASIVNDTNQAPVAASGTGYYANSAGSAFSYTLPTGSFTDPDGDKLTLSAKQADGSALPGWLKFDALTGSFSSTAAIGGAYAIAVTATDPKGASVTETIRMEFSAIKPAANQAPVVTTTIPDLYQDAGSTVSFRLPGHTFTDPEGGKLTYSAKLADGSALPAWLKFDAATQTFSGTAPVSAGQLQVVVTATDAFNASASDTFNLKLAPIYGHNTTYQDVAGENQYLVGTSQKDIFKISGVSTDYQWGATQDGTGIVLWKRADPGSYDILVNFDKLWFSDRSFNLNTQTGPDYFDDSTMVQTLTGTSALDRFFVNGNSSDYRWGATADGKGIVIWATSGANDTYDVLKGFEQIVFLDKTIKLGEAAANHAPTVATPIPDVKTSTISNFQFTLPDGVFADADGDKLTYTASLKDGAALPSWLSFDAATRTFSGTPSSGGAYKTYEISVTASDGHGGTVTDTFDLVVTGWQRPPRVFTPIEDQTGHAGNTFQITVPEGVFTNQIVSYKASLGDGSALPDWLKFDAATKTFSGTPPAGHEAVLELRVTATDKDGGSGSDVFKLTIDVPHNAAPVVSHAIENAHATAGWNFSFALPDHTFSDADGDTLTFSAKLAGGAGLPDWLKFDAATHTFSGQAPGEDIGKTFAIEVTASDGHGGTVTDTFDIEVGRWDRPPRVWDPIDDQTVTAEKGFTFTVPNGTFADDNIVGYSATLSDGTALPSWLKFDAASKTFTGTPGAGQVGSLEIKVTATDASGGTGSDTFKLTIGAAPAHETLHQNTAGNQTITGTDAKDVFVVGASSEGYHWGATQDGKGVVLWNDKGFDILFNVEEVRFTNKTATDTVLGKGVSQFHDDPDSVQYLTGKTDADTFIIDGKSSDFGWGTTQDGKGVVVWDRLHDGHFDILTSFEKLVFTDGQVDISHLGTV